MADLDRLEVQVEASAAKANAELDKMLGKLDKIINSLSVMKLGKSVNLDAELKNVADSMDKVKQSAKGVTSPKMDISQIEQTVSSLREQFKNIGKDFKFTGDAAQAEKEIAYLQSKFEKLRERESKAITLGKVDTVSFKSLQYDIALTTNKLSVLQERLKDLSEIRQPQIDFDVAEINRRVEELRVKFKDIGKDFKFTGDVDQLFTALDETKEKLNELEQKNFQLLISGKVDEELQKEIIKTENMLDSLKQKQDEFASAPRIEIMGGYEDLSASINDFMRSMEEAESLAGRTDGFQVSQRGMLSLVSVSNTARNVLSGLVSTVRTLGSSLSSLVTRIKKVTSGMANLVSKAMKLKDLMLRLGRANKKNDASFSKGLKTILKYTLGIRSLYVLVNRIRRAIISGYGNLAQHSDQVNSSISGMSSALLRLKNAFAVAFAPIVNIVAPYITAFINMISDALNTVGRFFAALTGKTFAAQATKVYKDYAKGLTGVADSAKDAKKSLSVLGFDQLNQLQDDSGADNGKGSGSGEISPADMFTDVPIESAISEWAQKIREAFLAGKWEELGSIIADGINVGLQKIYDAINWENVGPKITHFVESFTTTFNSLVEHINWELIGRVIGAGINTIVNSFNLLVGPGGIDFENIGKKLSEGFRGLLDEVEWVNFGNAIGNYFMISWRIFDGLVADMWRSDDAGLTGWSQLGISIADALNGVLQRINFGQIGGSLGKAITGIFQSAIDFAGTFDWKPLGFKIANGINEFFRKFDAKTVAAGASEVIKGILDSMITAVQNVDWGLLGRKIAEFLANIDWVGITERLSELIGSVIGGIAAFLAGVFQDVGKDIIWGLLFGIGDKLADIAAWIKEHIFNPFIEGFKEAFGIHSPSEKMKPYGKYILEGVIEGLKNTFGEWRDALNEWYSNHIAPWFTAQKWSELYDAIKTNLKSKWDETVGQWAADISSWWSSHVAPWFTLSKWEGIAAGIKNGIINKFKDMVAAWKSDISSWWSSHVMKYFSASTWLGIGNDMKKNLLSGLKGVANGVVGILNNVLSGFEGLLNKVIKGINDIIDKINSNKIAEFVGVEIGHVDKVKIPRIPAFASGGYPETGQLFLARENGINEMIGRIGSRSAVANNDQIVEAVSSGVAGAVADVMMAFMGQGSDSAAPVLEFTLKTDSETLYRIVQKGKEKHDRRWHVAAEI